VFVSDIIVKTVDGRYRNVCL